MGLRRALRHLIAIVVLGLGTSPAGATILTFVASGTLGNSFGSLQAGDAYTLTYSVDTTVPGTLIFQIGQTTFVSFDNVVSSTVRIGSWLATSQGLTREIDDPALDQYEMFSGAVVAPPVGGLDVSFFTLALFDSSGALVADAFSPLTDLSPFDQSGFAIVLSDGETTLAVGGTVSSITLVPEPGTLLLSVSGSAALVARRRLAMAPRAQVS